MLRFFRNIRKKLLEQEKVRKYFWYAIGEVFLVVIGILIALQVNNWNEERKKQNQFEEIVYSLEDNLEKNFEIIQFYPLFFEEVIRLHDQILDPPESIDSVNFTRLESIKYSEQNFRFLDFEGLDQLKNLASSSPEKYKQLLQLSVYYEYWRSVFIQNNISTYEAIQQLDNYLIRNLETYSNDDQQSLKQNFDFYSTDPAARNWIYKMRKLRTNAYSSLSAVESSYLSLLASIKNSEESFNTKDLTDYLNQKGLELPKSFSCGKVNFTMLKNQSFFSLYYNATNEIKKLNRIGASGNVVENFSIEPKTFIVFGQRPGLPVELLDNDGKCEKQMVSDTYGFYLVQ